MYKLRIIQKILVWLCIVRKVYKSRRTFFFFTLGECGICVCSLWRVPLLGLSVWEREKVCSFLKRKWLVCKAQVNRIAMLDLLIHKRKRSGYPLLLSAG